MKILLINQAFHPDVAATAQQLTDLAVDLAKNGHDVTVLAGRRGYAEPHPVFFASETYQGVKIIRVWPFTLGRKYRFARILDAVCLNLSFALRLLWFSHFDVMVVMTTPPLVAWIASFFAKTRKARFVYWVMDINPDEAIEAGWLRKDSFAAKALEKVSKWVLKKSDAIVVLDRFMQERLVAKGADAERMTVIPPWSHNEDLATIPHEKNPFRKKYGLDRKFVVMYSGNHSICHPLDTLLGAALALKDDPSVLFVFIGGGERVQDVTRFKDRNGLSNILQLPYQARQDMKFSLSGADIHVVIMGGPYVGIVHPCKIYGILMIGRPFLYIGPRTSPIGEMILREGLGYQVEHGDKERVVEGIRNLRSLEEFQKIQIQRRSQKLAAEKFSRDVLSPQLIKAVIG
ncbi:MAG: glycosyltransferase family 4 protein [Candidatus Omnitrophica bacterium]|nr:glycosyltransferase family 4 protein [Candidatus Omnitrophota bacterium]